MPTVTRWADEPGLGELLAAYHLATEAEKGTAVATVADLPARYRAEVLAPKTAFADATVLVAVADPNAPPVGCVVVTPPSEAEVELKRLWVAEHSRGQGVAGALMRAALAHAESAGAGVRLSVWQWRTDAIELYVRHGFVETEPWDDRPGLLCLRLVV